MPAPSFPANPASTTPFSNGHFRIKWDGVYVPGVFRISGLERTTAIVADGEPGPTIFPAITLERPLTADTRFEQWANKVWNHRHAVASASMEEPGPTFASPDLHKDILIEIYDADGHKLLAYRLYGCWPSHYTAFSPLDTATTGPVTETLTLQLSGWERDTAIPDHR
jgi:phage tail-like protein